ncbi:NELL2-interacting cell ontogeny regulator 1 isoform X3 [Hemitrygon akajei]|uniref:NELL2-interacting cell ontogeny regulator 1 isoform X3 n=1 Tax=Hemitrygon akajei TaxID=2704970 RepID=UPI003BF99465
MDGHYTGRRKPVLQAPPPPAAAPPTGARQPQPRPLPRRAAAGVPGSAGIFTAAIPHHTKRRRSSASRGQDQDRSGIAMLTARFLGLIVLVAAAGFLAEADAESGTVIPAESRPCVDCHAFEFMQRALQDLKRTANNLNTRTDDLLLRVEKRALCDCLPSNL